MNRILRTPDQSGISSFAGAAAIAGIGVVFLVVFLIATSGGSKKANDTPKDNTSQSQTDSNASSQPTVIRIPEDYTVYANKDFEFSFAYPTPWGTLTGTAREAGGTALFTARSGGFNSYALGSSVLNGQLTAFVYDKDDFKISTHDNGPMVTAAKLGDTYGWKVVQAGPADPKLQVGDNYNVKSAKYQAGVDVFDLSINEKNTLQSRWVIASGDNFIVVNLPTINRADGSAPPANDLAVYNAVAGNIAKTLRPTL